MQLEKYRRTLQIFQKNQNSTNWKKLALSPFSKIPLPSIELHICCFWTGWATNFSPTVSAHNKWQKQVQLLLIRTSMWLMDFLSHKLKTQLEMYRSHADNVLRNQKSINEKTALIDLLKMVAAQYKASQTRVWPKWPVYHQAGILYVDQGPARILDVPRYSSKNTKTVLKALLELLDSVPNMPISEQMERMKKPELVNLL